MKFGSLFSGVGGMDLGLERAGMECRWQVENDAYATRVLEKHWPDVPKYGDIREVDFERVERVDLVAGGFPCQDLSYAGKGLGLSGARSGLWSEFKRCIRVVRPRFVLVENVPGLLSRGMGAVLGDLASLGYDAEWESLPAAAFGAPHLRWRIFIVAHANRLGCHDSSERLASVSISSRYASSQIRARVDASYLDRVNDGIPARVHRLRGLGNAVVPQVAEWVGHRIMEAA